ncbi:MULTISPECIES: CRISPR-associated endonuclease Cas2 [Cyanophyceae]|uniref:CRISPR-associated endonuclease Cas2 n=1 Tax=Cyanophyceae TaxID=3028117 RepID=UPI00016DCCAA|nr:MULTISPECIES: CRISPR-associated endonuclease Cas2 [Cyanophyceae]ACA99767.1 CRISPR-associated protein [Picosynechococcus sp. PCC 7002]SMH55948.1 CRISPR-associated protein, Cas2 family [Picosynechococcus sp. OG1]SMQ83355.1 CRISPR-associated protein, Cas2 family [Synechococcus sp. 7002]
MAELKHWYLVCYDIRSQKRWRKAYKLLEGYGERIQYSIFRCWLTQRSREKLRWQLEEVLTKEDDLLLIRLSQQCVQDLPKYNRPNTWLFDEQTFKVL